MGEQQYWTVCFAGLLHSISKYLQSNNNIDIVCKSDFLNSLDVLESMNDSSFDKFLFKSLIYNKQEDSAENIFAALICSAESYIESDESSKDIDGQSDALQNIFSRIEIEGKTGDNKKVYDTSPFKPELILPRYKETEPLSLDNLVRSLISEIEKLKILNQSPEEVFRRIHLLLKKYCWCLPANPYDESADISLFEHASIISAIASCLYKYHDCNNSFRKDSFDDDQKPRFLLIAGDISGIQKYIIGEGKQTPNGLVRRLRARSFIISALTNLASFSIIQACGLPQSCILQNTGGNFLLLLPNTDFCYKHLSDISQKIDNQLFKRYQGELHIYISDLAITGADLETFGQVIDNVKSKLTIKKNMPMISKLMKHDAWNEEEFIIHNDIDNKGMGLCTGCYKEYADRIIDDEKIGSRCYNETSIGSHLPSQSYYSLREMNNEFISAGYYSLSTDLSEGIKVAIDSKSEESSLFWPISTYVPTRDGHLLTFEEIAEKSNGLLGWLKADVDNLRALFSHGLRYENGERNDTVSRIMTISRMLDSFFSQWLPEYISKNFSKCYIVYAGGDDLLIVGPWNDIIGLAGAVRINFINFTGNHPWITISAGIAITNPRLPIGRAFRLVDDALSLSKLKDKDQITLFGKTVKWDNMPDIINECLRLKEWHQNKILSSSDLYKFKHFSKMFEKFELEGSVDQLSYAGMLSWEIGKKLDENKKLKPEVVKWMEKLFDVGSNAIIRYLEIACDFALLSNRRRDM